MLNSIILQLSITYRQNNRSFYIVTGLQDSYSFIAKTEFYESL